MKRYSSFGDETAEFALLDCLAWLFGTLAGFRVNVEFRSYEALDKAWCRPHPLRPSSYLFLGVELDPEAKP